MVQSIIWGEIRLIAVEIRCREGLWARRVKGGGYVMVSTLKFGMICSNRRFFGVDTANFVRCRGGTRVIPVPVIPHPCRIRYIYISLVVTTDRRSIKSHPKFSNTLQALTLLVPKLAYEKIRLYCICTYRSAMMVFAIHSANVV